MRRRMGPSWTPPPWRALAVGVVAAGAAVLAGAGRITSWPIFLPAGALYVAVVGLACARAEHLRLADVSPRQVAA